MASRLSSKTLDIRHLEHNTMSRTRRDVMWGAMLARLAHPAMDKRSADAQTVTIVTRVTTRALEKVHHHPSVSGFVGSQELCESLMVLRFSSCAPRFARESPTRAVARPNKSGTRQGVAEAPDESGATARINYRR